MSNDHSKLPVVATARLPVAYVDARDKLAACARIDECKDWSDKAEAMASYARQADDDTMLNTAMRIKARAIQRCGELLREIKAAKGNRTDLQPSRDAPTKLNGATTPTRGRMAAAAAAGLSKDQAVQALRVAAVPAPVFETLVEHAEKPATVTQLAKLGTKPAAAEKGAADYLEGRDPAEFNVALHARAGVRAFVQQVAAARPDVVVRGSRPHEYERLSADLDTVRTWLAAVQCHLDAATQAPATVAAPAVVPDVEARVDGPKRGQARRRSKAGTPRRQREDRILAALTAGPLKKMAIFKACPDGRGGRRFATKAIDDLVRDKMIDKLRDGSYTPSSAGRAALPVTS